MKQAVIIHGFGGSPDNGFKGWLKNELEQAGWTVFNPQMPNPKQPLQQDWVNTIIQNIPNPDQQTYLVGHSLGCIAILRYLEQLPNNIKIGGVFLVAGFSQMLKDAKYQPLANFFNKPIAWPKIKQVCPNLICFFSNNDWAVPAKQITPFKQQGAKIIILPDRGHFSDNDGCINLPELKQAILNLSKKPA
ncbi:alpha/beta hydrolase [Patescibacteria group bacterium]|nr:alpha/beta hydrolase [Patescibacteria group bacterium]